MAVAILSSILVRIIMVISLSREFSEVVVASSEYLVVSCTLLAEDGVSLVLVAPLQLEWPPPFLLFPIIIFRLQQFHFCASSNERTN